MTTNPNPYDNTGAWGHVLIGGFRVPGVITSIDGAERPEEWDVQKPTKKGGASTVWKGTAIADTIKLVTELPNRASVDRYYRLKDILRPPKSTDAPPALPIVSPIINFNGITRVAYRVMSPPKWVASGGFWRGTIELIDFSPPEEVKTGVARPAAAKRFTETTESPNQGLRDEFSAKVQQAFGRQQRSVRRRAEGGRIRNGGAGV